MHEAGSSLRSAFESDLHEGFVCCRPWPSRNYYDRVRVTHGLLGGRRYNKTELLRTALLERFSFERRELGQDALLSHAMATIQNVEGVAYVDVDKFDWIDEKKVIEHLSGRDSLGDNIARKERIVVSLARVDTNETNPAARIKPAEIAYMSPDIPDTIILSEIAS